MSLIVYLLVIVLASLAGGWLPSTVRMTHRRMQGVLSFVAGVMLGVATMHLIPHAALALGRVETAMAITLAGILAMFFLNRIFHFHQHMVAEEAPSPSATGGSCGHPHPEPPQGHVHHETAESRALTSGDVSSLGLFFGLAVHTLLDGLALAAAVAAEPRGHWSLAGFSVFLAIVLHKPLDAMSITGLMKSRGWDETRITAINLAFSLMVPAGALLFVLGSGLGAFGPALAGGVMAFAGGVFLCISLGDLLPEVHFHRHDRVSLSFALLAGILLATAVEWLPGHRHVPAETSRGDRAVEGDRE